MGYSRNETGNPIFRLGDEIPGAVTVIELFTVQRELGNIYEKHLVFIQE